MSRHENSANITRHCNQIKLTAMIRGVILLTNRKAVQCSRDWMPAGRVPIQMFLGKQSHLLVYFLSLCESAVHCTIDLHSV